MKQILVAIDERTERELERVAPARKRMRAEFIRLAIRRAIDLARDRSTEQAYRLQPLDASLTARDMQGWDEQNQLAGVGPRSKGSLLAASARSKRRGRP